MKLMSTALLAMTLFAGVVVTGCESSTTTKDTPGGLLTPEKHEQTTTTHNDITGDTQVHHTEQTNP